MRWKQFENTSYEISDRGDVYSSLSDRILLTNDDGNGYQKVTLWVKGVQTSEKVHRLVAKCFIENPDNFLTVNHIDCNKQNNCYSNLEWLSHVDNMKHAWGNGLMKSGSDCYIAKLDEAGVLKIKHMFILGMSNSEIANLTTVTRGTISKIRDKKTWKAVAPELEWPNSFKKVKKLCGKNIPAIRQKHAEGVSLAEIGRQLGVHSGTISGVISGKTWKNY